MVCSLFFLFRSCIQVVVVPLNETSESGVVEQVEVESSEILETEVVHDDTQPATAEQVRVQVLRTSLCLDCCFNMLNIYSPTA